MLAAMIAPEFALDTTSTEFDGGSEAHYLAASIKAVSDHYEQKFFDKKTVDWINLLQALGVVYGTRLFAIKSRRTAERARVVNPPPSVKSENPAQFHQSAPQPNGKTEPPPRPPNSDVGHIPGVGPVQFPEGHPFNPRKH